LELAWRVTPIVYTVLTFLPLHITEITTAPCTHLTVTWHALVQQEDEGSPIDAIDEVLFFAQAWDGIEGAQGAGRQDKMLEALDEGQRTFMQSILATVPQRLALQQQPHAMQQSHTGAVGSLLTGAAAAVAAGAAAPAAEAFSPAVQQGA
jgi:hypothetical protein